MSHLILTICLLASPDACREERIATEARMGLPMECTAAMNEWATQHPAWRVVRWRCGLREEAI
ncbi:conserved hypothetical protein [Ancylobacter novellus DSM 506]|uniref:Secreted protein n=1 Tax=Ancylobacter novellus (strain ATCC 8093 / DSM 506 / JCM 20403 / CCM 1077 / IAM 12100 / NBRC 12443 / NCIMB 10456) TaxID=639283 RepID=D7A2E7_ANCN5|nr:hypothetical protein [Ancylobacter novellus]ADH89610.1 conserved hypothetical protein [Ancylobacter novellus DSM 506]